MEITWLGNACTRVRTRQAIVLMDPYQREAGLDMGRPTADIITVSHDDPRHGNVAWVRSSALVISAPGEYEVQGVQIIGVRSALRAPAGADAAEGAQPERSTVYLVEAEGLHVAHLGAVGRQPSAAEAELLSNADILVIALGEDGLTPDEAARTVRALEPTIIIPVGYSGAADDPVLKAFLTAAGIAVELPIARLSVQGRAATEAQRVVLLEPRG